MESLPEVTIVLCTYNRADMLRAALESLMALETNRCFRYEIVVVDNDSTDATPRVLEHAASNSPVEIRGVLETRPGVACARNRGVAEARGEWIAFFDDDQVADPMWLSELLATAHAKQVRCAGGRVKLLLPQGCERNLAPVCRGVLGESVGLTSLRRYGRKVPPGAGNMMLHRSVFEQVGVFDESLREGGEDCDLFRRMRAAGIEAWYTPKAIVHHVIPDHRLKDDYLLWTFALRAGHTARREWDDYGRLAFPFVLTARIAQGLVLFLPKFLRARLRGRPEEVLAARCLLWRTTGYIRFGIWFLFPRWFAQRKFFARLDFRANRQGPLSQQPGDGLCRIDRN